MIFCAPPDRLFYSMEFGRPRYGTINLVPRASLFSTPWEREKYARAVARAYVISSGVFWLVENARGVGQFCKSDICILEGKHTSFPPFFAVNILTPRWSGCWMILEKPLPSPWVEIRLCNVRVRLSGYSHVNPSIGPFLLVTSGILDLSGSYLLNQTDE